MKYFTALLLVVLMLASSVFPAHARRPQKNTVLRTERSVNKHIVKRQNGVSRNKTKTHNLRWKRSNKNGDNIKCDRNNRKCSEKHFTEDERAKLRRQIEEARIFYEE